MSSDNRDEPVHSSPIPIAGQNRRRAMSYSSSSSEGSPSSPQSVQTPITPYPPKIATSPTSPILSYFMGASPTKTSATFPFRRPSGFPGAGPVFEDDETQEDPLPTHNHVRRATTAGWGASGRFPQPNPIAVPAVEHVQRDRGAGVLRRLSLSAGFGLVCLVFNPVFWVVIDKAFLPESPIDTPRPATPPPSAYASVPPANSLPTANPNARKARRATMMGAAPEPRRRAPSPMGERILKGHFDGFN
ncbi:hypothetical protein OF83DRAFT_1225593 [Amylostereum chailletii]|nr:hypothetical protein OF83DRAFT_1225593 [Amylostereum chailletii]